MIRPLVVGNWKMHGDGTWLPAIGAIAEAAAVTSSIDTALCVPATLIERAATRYPSLSIGGQDCHPDNSGSFTGDISASMIREAGGKLVILGHSECRSAPLETSARVAAKVRAATTAGLRVIVCVGETTAARAAGEAVGKACDQLLASLVGVVGGNIVVAYEPVWAIGQGITPTANEIAEVTSALRLTSVQAIGSASPILYGGSVNSENCEHLFHSGGIDGFLIGKASTEAKSFIRVLKLAERAVGNAALS